MPRPKPTRARRVRESKRPGVPGYKLVVFAVECCFGCGALVDKLTPWMVWLVFGTQHLERDEVPLGNVGVWSRWCRRCFVQLSDSGRLLVRRGDVELELAKIVLEGKMDVRRDRIINAWVVRKVRAAEE